MIFKSGPIMPVVGYAPAIAHVGLHTTRLAVGRACAAAGSAKARVEGVVGPVLPFAAHYKLPIIAAPAFSSRLSFEGFLSPVHSLVGRYTKRILGAFYYPVLVT